MGNIEEIGRSLELPIGTRFYYENRLCEVVDSNLSYCCPKCEFFDKFWNDPMCEIMICNEKDRHDGKRVIFKEIEKATD